MGLVSFLLYLENILRLQSIFLLSFNMMLIQKWERKKYYSLLVSVSQESQNVSLSHLQINITILRSYFESSNLLDLCVSN